MTALTTENFPKIIHWKTPGYYHHHETGWKYCDDQNRTDQNSLRKYFKSKQQATRFGLKINT